MIKGLMLTPPVVGRISIGKVVERHGKRLPEKDDEFTLTSQVQARDGWVLHPLDERLRQALTSQGGQDGTETSKVNRVKLRSIPVRLLFDDPELNLRASYSLFDRATGRPLCVGNGQTCKRSTASGVQSLPCPSPEGCTLAERGCKALGRLNVRVVPDEAREQVDGNDSGTLQEERPDDDELSCFIFRTTGFNSIRTLSTRLMYFHALSGGHLSTMPLALRLRGKSTAQSHRAPIYYVDLTLRNGWTLVQAIEVARQETQRREAAGFCQSDLDTAAREGLLQGAFEETMEDGGAVVEEFYPDGDVTQHEGDCSTEYNATAGDSSALAKKLARQWAKAIQAPESSALAAEADEAPQAAP